MFSLAAAGQLNSQGASGWRTLAVNAQSDQRVQLIVTVQNSADAAALSTIDVDQVTEDGVVIEALTLYDERSKAKATEFDLLERLSVSAHSAFPATPANTGKTVVRGTIKIQGSPTDTLANLKLEVYEGGVKRATGTLTSQSSSILNATFGTNGLSIASPTLMFAIPSSELATIDQTTNGDLTLRFVATTGRGYSHYVERKVTKLVWYTGTNRYLGRDLNNCASQTAILLCGGDSWALPNAVARSLSISGSVIFGDFGNMNAGFFPPHTSHNVARDVDFVWNDGKVFAVNKATAEKLIALFNGTNGDNIEFVYLTFDVSQPNAANEFWDTIRDATVNGVRLIPEEVAAHAEANPTNKAKWRIRDVGRVRFRPGHDDHGHIRWVP